MSDMLIRFNIKNFLSFNKTDDGKSIEFSMIAGRVSRKNEHIYDDKKIKLLKLATVYGANASGKSNLVKALDFMRKMVIDGFPEGYSNMFCKLDEENKDLPSYFELEIKINDKYYAYGFEAILSQRRFISEWLLELAPNGKDKYIFNRNIEKNELNFGTSIKRSPYFERFKIYADDIKEDNTVLFLRIMNENKKAFYQGQRNMSINALKNIYNWIYNSLDINYPDRPISNYDYLLREDNVDYICGFISSFGTGITDFKMIEISLEKVLEKLPEIIKKRLMLDLERKKVEINQIDLDKKSTKIKKNIIRNAISIRSNQNFFIIDVNNNGVSCKTIQFQHETKDIFFELNEESDGTKRILDLIEILLSKGGKTFVIDELDRCLHPALTYRFIELFLQLAQEKEIQLIVTTHESRLLDFDLLRRDEIWFIDKNNRGESQVYSLEEYNERFDKKIDKAYLDGRYGGIPIFNTLFPVINQE